MAPFFIELSISWTVKCALPVSIICIGYKNIPVSIDDALKAVQGERNVVTTISARSAQRI